MMMTRRRTSRRDERGAVAVMVAMLTVVLFGFSAVAVDITMQVNNRQELHDTIDEGVHAGAYDLPATSAEATAIAFAKSMDPNSNPSAKLYCVVSSLPLAGLYIVDASQIPATCNPGLPPYNVGKYGSDLKCNSQICKIPCYPASGGQCNTIYLEGQKPVGFGFARALGINQGSTGTVASAACKGACGGAINNPLDLVVVGDRTGSMGSAKANLADARQCGDAEVYGRAAPQPDRRRGPRASPRRDSASPDGDGSLHAGNSLNSADLAR